MKLTLAALSIWVAAACTQGPPPADGTASAADTAPSPSAQVAPGGLTGREWSLTKLGDRTDPLGAGGRRVTLNFDSAEMRAMGFAGCNRYAGPYTISGDSISFGPAISTKMACSEGMDVETNYLGALPQVVRFALSDSTLTLFAATTPLAVFSAAPRT